MATIIRCDECKKLSDSGIGYVGRKWALSEYRTKIAVIELTKDLCRDCLVKLMSAKSLSESNNIEDY